MKFIKGSEQLVQAMGYWPSFHDATVVESSRTADSFSVKLHVFAMTDKMDSVGYYLLEKHHLVSFRFLGVKTNTLPAGYANDCLSSLTFRKSGELLQAEFESHMDQDGIIICAGISVTEVIRSSGHETGSD